MCLGDVKIQEVITYEEIYNKLTCEAEAMDEESMWILKYAKYHWKNEKPWDIIIKWEENS